MRYPLNQIVATIPRVRPAELARDEDAVKRCEYCGDGYNWQPVNCGYCGRWVCCKDIDRQWGCCRPCATYIESWMNPPSSPAGDSDLGAPPLLGPLPNPFGLPGM